DPAEELAERAGDPQVSPSDAEEVSWLQLMHSPTKDPVPCHGQMSSVNVWLDGDAAYVVGWAKGRLADPEYDLAYTKEDIRAAALYLDNAIYRRGMKMARDPLIESYLEAYKEASSRPLDDAALRYWQVHHLTAVAADCTRRELDLITGPDD